MEINVHDVRSRKNVISVKSLISKKLLDFTTLFIKRNCSKIYKKSFFENIYLIYRNSWPFETENQMNTAEFAEMAWSVI